MPSFTARRGYNGFRMYLGSLAPGTTTDDVYMWFCRSYLAGQCQLVTGLLDQQDRPLADPMDGLAPDRPWELDIADINVIGGANTGCMQAYVTARTSEAPLKRH